MKFSKANLVNDEHRFYLIENELKVIVRRPEPVEGFFALAEYSNQ
jgi:hypothetical protein